MGRVEGKQDRFSPTSVFCFRSLMNFRTKWYFFIFAGSLVAGSGGGEKGGFHLWRRFVWVLVAALARTRMMT